MKQQEIYRDHRYRGPEGEKKLKEGLEKQRRNPFNPGLAQGQRDSLSDKMKGDPVNPQPRVPHTT
jgi:hypothetical protein